MSNLYSLSGLMMNTQFDLKNCEQMQRVAVLMTTTPQIVDGMIERFPFHHLCDVCPLNIEIVRNMCDVCGIFVKYGNIKDNLLTMMRFYYQTIQFHINSDDCDFIVMERCLEEFKNCLLKEAELALNYVNTSLVSTLHSIAHHPNVTEDLLRLCIETLTNFLWRKFERETNFGEYCIGMWKVAIELPIEDRLAMANSIICNTDSAVFPQITEVYRYLTEVVKSMAEYEAPLIKTILTCVLNVYTKCKSKNILKPISIALANISFPKCIANYFLLTENNLQEMHDILYNEITVLFDKTPWNSVHDNLRDIVCNLGKPFLVKHDPEDKTDFSYLMLYLELVYRDVRHTEVPVIRNIVKEYGERLPTNPAVLKAIYQLFAAYCHENMSLSARTVQSDLLLSLQYCEDLDNYVTYHIAQLAWVLRCGSRILKRRVVTSWVRQRSREDVMALLCKSLKASNQVATLLDVIFTDDDMHVKREALDLFLYCAPGKRNLLTHLLLRPDLTVNTLDTIMRGRPKEIILGLPEDPKYHDELLLCRTMVMRIIGIVTNEALGLLDSTRCMLLVHLHNTCWQLRNTDFAVCFITGRLARVLVDATKSKSSVDIWNAYEFLMLIATTQVSLKIITSEKVMLEPTPFQPDTKMLKSAMRLYEYALNPSYGNNWLITLEGQYLSLYQYLMDVLTSSEGPAVYEVITQMLERFDYCVTSMVNICTIRMHCRLVTLNVNFVKYLTIWCQMAQNNKHIRIPVKNINPFVKHLDIIEYRDADYAVLKRFATKS